jgi:uncharacterized protein YndB with AHSA1/START domain
MGTRIRVATTIRASPDTTWSAIEKLETHVNWMADAESIAFLTAQHSGVGTMFARLVTGARCSPGKRR